MLLSQQMELTQRFRAVTCKKSVSISELQENHHYIITQAVKKSTKFGETILLTLRDSDDLFSVFLPKRYLSAFTKHDIEQVNDEKLSLRFIYNGMRWRLQNLNKPLKQVWF
jgi:hypothetical protein